MTTKLLFDSTQEACKEITRLFEFVWPTAVALWNLRWQVDGFMKSVPDATWEDVNARFVVGSKIHGADIRRMSKQVSWEDQKEQFAKFVLTNAFAIYESWAKNMIAVAALSNYSGRSLWRIGVGQSKGINDFITEINAYPSDTMARCFKPAFATHKKYLPNLLDSMMKCYIYFKQIRNCQIHNGGIADQRSVDAYTAFAPVASASSLRTKENLEHFSVVLDKPVRLSLRGVTGFCDILLRLMITTDIEISGSELAERIVLERAAKINLKMTTLNSRAERARQQVTKVCDSLRLPAPTDEGRARQFFIENRLLSR